MLILKVLVGVVIANCLVVLSSRYCFKYSNTFTIVELLPLLNYRFLLGRHKKYILVFSYCFMGIVVSFIEFNVIGIIRLILVSLLFVVALIDYWLMIIPNGYLITLGIVVLISLIVEDSFIFIDCVIGAFSFSGLMFLINVFKSNSFGYGDIKLMFVVGFLLGFKQVMQVGVLAVVLAGVVAGLLKVINPKIKIMPFGPFLSFASIIILLKFINY